MFMGNNLGSQPGMPGSSTGQRAGGDLGAADICEENDYPIGNNVSFPAKADHGPA
jgi:hypothetical protein